MLGTLSEETESAKEVAEVVVTMLMVLVALGRGVVGWRYRQNRSHVYLVHRLDPGLDDVFWQASTVA